MLQTLNRDPRLRKVDNSTKQSSTLNDNVKQPIIKNKEEKKLDKPKRDSSKHRDLKRKDRSPSCSPSKKELLKKSHKKTDRKERSPKDEKHKRRDEKKNREPDLKKKNVSSNVKGSQNVTAIVKCEVPIKDEEKLLKGEPKSNDSCPVLPVVVEPLITKVPKEDVKTNLVKEMETNNSVDVICELGKTDSPLGDSESLKRLRMYMQAMKKSPEPSTATIQPLTSIELKNDSDIPAVKTNQSKNKMSGQPYVFIKFIVGNFLLFLNKLYTILLQNKMEKCYLSTKSYHLDFFYLLFDKNVNINLILNYGLLLNYKCNSMYK